MMPTAHAPPTASHLGSVREVGVAMTLTERLRQAAVQRAHRTGDEPEADVVLAEDGVIDLRHYGDTTRLPTAGRRSQLAILQSRWAQACDGLGQIVLIIGEEGTGKSVLANELQQGVEHSSDAITVKWSCLPRNQGRAFSAAVDWLQNVLELSAAHPLPARDEVALRLAERGLAAPGADATAIEMLGSGDDDPSQSTTHTQRRDRLQTGILQWLKDVSERRPVLFIVEDLQWVDAATLSLLSEVAEQGLNDRRLTVLTLRPDFETPWGSRAHQTQLALNRFGRRQVTEVLTESLGPSRVDSQMIETAWKRTGGVPEAVVRFARSRTEHTDGGRT